MIDIKDKKLCCGCNACVQRCPKQCIAVQEDEEGFLYPTVDLSICIDCGLCEKVCPVINQESERNPIEVFAAVNKDASVRMQSSSGGIFTALAEKIIQEKGVVFGARFDEKWEVMHDYTETIEGLKAFRGSKYVQSRIGDTFRQAEFFLKTGRKVMFTGTPCQIAGLRLFLRKEYENLLAVDIICHGVPSPMVWRKYLGEKIQQDGLECIQSISFRNKNTGWKNYSFQIEYDKNHLKSSFSEYASQNIFMKGFLADLYLRPSCYACPAKKLKSGSDITLGDFWGIQRIKPELDDDKGISCILINTIKGQHIFELLSLFQELSSCEEVSKENPALIHSVKLDKKRREKFYRFYPFHDLSDVLAQTLHMSLGELIWRKLCHEYNLMTSIINKR